MFEKALNHSVPFCIFNFRTDDSYWHTLAELDLIHLCGKTPSKKVALLADSSNSSLLQWIRRSALIDCLMPCFILYCYYYNKVSGAKQHVK